MAIKFKLSARIVHWNGSRTHWARDISQGLLKHKHKFQKFEKHINQYLILRIEMLLLMICKRFSADGLIGKNVPKWLILLWFEMKELKLKLKNICNEVQWNIWLSHWDYNCCINWKVGVRGVLYMWVWLTYMFETLSCT